MKSRFVYLAVLLGLACGSDDDPRAPAGPTAPSAPAPEGSAPGPRPAYVIANELYSPGNRSDTYVNVVDSLDVRSLDTDKAIEFAGGRATIAGYHGWLFVAPPMQPVITRYAVGADGKLTKEADINFMNFGFNQFTIDEWVLNFLSPEKAYLLNLSDGAVVVWNPTSMQILGKIDPPTFPWPPGKTLDSSAGVVRGNRLFRVFYFSNWETYEFSAEQYLAVYDTETDRLLQLIDERRCPALGNRVSRAADGTLYFSSWIWPVGATLVKRAPESCALRIAADQERFDPDWVLRYPELTGGRQGAMFNLLSDGTALLSVFHQERATIGATTHPPELVSTDNWRLWTVDLAQRSAQPLEGIDWMAGAASTFVIDGRSFVFVPSSDWSATHVYELKDAKPEKRLDVKGWSYQMAKIR